MNPSNTYRMYWLERPKSAFEMQRADEQIGRLASAVSSVFRGLSTVRESRRRRG
jgi:hypothetical protein